MRDVMLLEPAIEALEAQKEYTYKQKRYVFHNPRTNEAWETDHQIRRTAWIYALERAGFAIETLTKPDIHLHQ